MTGYGEASYQSDASTWPSSCGRSTTATSRSRSAPPSRTTCSKPSSRRSSAAPSAAAPSRSTCAASGSSPPRTSRSTPSPCAATSTQLRAACAELGLPDGGQALLGAGAGPARRRARAGQPARFSLDEEWPVIERVLEQALGRLQAMRLEEGRAMAQELLQHRDHIGRELDADPRARRRRSPSPTATACSSACAAC